MSRFDAIRFQERQTPAQPVDAATLLVLREQGGELELFFVRRHAKSAFLGGAVVFPGGKLDAADAALGAERTSGVHPRALEFAENPGHALALAVCACRESLEEAAIAPSRPAADAAAVERARAALDGGAPLPEVLAQLGVVFDTAALVPFARWVTPEAESRRFDARFFLTALPAGQEARHDARETTSGVWSTPERMLEAFAEGDLFLAPPTLRALELLRSIRSVAEALALGAEQSLAPICPTFVPGDPPMLTLPGDPLHAIGERRVAGPTRFVLRDGKFLSEDP